MQYEEPPFSAYIRAAEDGRVEEIRRMIQRSEEVLKERGVFGTSALHRAAQFGRVEVVRELLKAGIDPSIREGRRRTPLHDAAEGDHSLFCLRLLLAAGSNVEAKDVYGDTPLMAAITHANLSSVVMLLNAGADPTTKNRRRLTTLDAVQYQADGVDLRRGPSAQDHLRELEDIRFFLEDSLARRNL